MPAHSYFISYAWDDSAPTDHIEVLLHRKNRIINRDEKIFEAGEDLSDAVKSLIDQSDTFIALWSERFKKSKWCPRELKYAMSLKEKDHPKLKRVVLIAIDDTEVDTFDFTGKLHLPGVTRTERELAISKLVEKEAIN